MSLRKTATEGAGRGLGEARHPRGRLVQFLGRCRVAAHSCIAAPRVTEPGKEEEEEEEEEEGERGIHLQ